MITLAEIQSGAGFYSFPNAAVLTDRQDGFHSVPKPKLGLHAYENGDGSGFFAQYYEPRAIGFGGMVKGADAVAYGVARRELAKAFYFEGEKKLLKVTTDDGLQVQADVIPFGELSIPIRPATINYGFWTVDLLMPDPYFYSQVLKAASGGVATVTGGFNIPFDLPLDISGAITGLVTCQNDGSADVKKYNIRVRGPGTTFTITNKTTGKSITLDVTLTSSQYVDLNFGTKEAKRNDGTNVYGNVSGEFFPIGRGENLLALSVGSGNTADTGIEVSWRDAYSSL